MNHTKSAKSLSAKLLLSVATFALMASLSDGAQAAATGCNKGDVIYQFGFSDWKSQGTGWQAREQDFTDEKKGLSVFVNLTDQEAATMNDARSVTVKGQSILLRVECDLLPKDIVLQADPTNEANWTSAGGIKHALLTGPKKIKDAEKFNQNFQHFLINHSSQWQKSSQYQK